MKTSTCTPPLGIANMRDLDTIDAELRFHSAMRRSIRTHGGEPSCLRHQIDELLDELLDERYELTGN
jgi:organic radical activating enzyme